MTKAEQWTRGCVAALAALALIVVGAQPAAVRRRQAYHSHTRRGSRRNADGVASSSGRWSFQSPSSPRKVGMPEAALTPAPVRTRARRAPARMPGRE